MIWSSPPLKISHPSIKYLKYLNVENHKIKHFLCPLGLWTTSMTTHLTGPCWNRKQLNREPHPGAKASRRKPPQASKLTNPSLTWKVSSKQPSDVFLQTPIAYTFTRASAQTVWRLFWSSRNFYYFFGFLFITIRHCYIF